MTCSAKEQTGIAEIWETIGEYVSFAREHAYFDQKRSRQAKFWMYEFIHDSLQSHFYAHPRISGRLEQLEKQVMDGSISSFHAAMEILQEYLPD
jgi:LAO/AO transport system kinase